MTLFFAGVTWVIAGPHALPLDQLSTLPYDADDVKRFMWNLWWTRESLTSLANPYWSEIVFHPRGGSLALTSYPIPYGILSIPVQWIWPGLEGLAVAINLLVLFSFTLSGIGAYRLAKHVSASPRASLLAGIVFSTALFHTLNTVRLHLLAVEWLPFYVLCLLRLGEDPRLRRALALAAWMALCFYSSLEYAVYLLIFSSLWLAHRMVVQRRWEPRLWSRLLVAAGAFTALASPLLVQQIEQLPVAGARFDLEETVSWSPALLSIVTPSRVHPLYGEAMRFAGAEKDGQTVGMRSESSIGLATLALALLGIAGVRRNGGALYAIAAAVFLVLMLGPYLRVSGTWITSIPLPYLALYEWVPMIRVGRDPTRFVVPLLLMLSVLTALGTRRLLEPLRRPAHEALLLAGLCLLVLFEALPRGAPKTAPSSHPVYDQIARAPGDFAVLDHSGSYGGLVGQIVHGKRLTFVTGFPRSVPPDSPWELDSAFTLAPGVLRAAAGNPDLIDHLRAVRSEQRIRYAVLPEVAISEAQIRLCRRLGAQVQRLGGIVLCQFRDEVDGTPSR
ncbi:hypothetical protein MK489_12430 [Myxococcota bacterium]|nr:hypothetical protein [Myxococcota bacterium]